MSITREQVDNIYKGIMDLCLCRGCLFRDFLEAYHKNIVKLLDDNEKKISVLESEIKHLNEKRVITNIEELPDLTERAREFVEKMALHNLTLEIPTSELVKKEHSSTHMFDNCRLLNQDELEQFKKSLRKEYEERKT